MYKIIEAHWSTDKTNENHQQDDADCTYAVIDGTGDLLGIVTKLVEAKNMVGGNDYILC